MDSAFYDVIDFERAAGHKLSESPPAFPYAKVVELRRKLIKEEYDETETALQKIAATTNDDPKRDELIAELADGLADLIFVCVGTAIHFGVDLPCVWHEVCRSNMSKFAEGVVFRPDGKVLKSPKYEPANIIGVIKYQEPIGSNYDFLGPNAMDNL